MTDGNTAATTQPSHQHAECLTQHARISSDKLRGIAGMPSMVNPVIKPFLRRTLPHYTHNPDAAVPLSPDSPLRSLLNMSKAELERCINTRAQSRQALAFADGRIAQLASDEMSM